MLPWRATLSLSLLLALTSPAAAETPQAIWEAIRSAELEPSQSVTVSELEIDLGAATLNIDEGVLIPTTAIDGHIAEMIFLGSARFFMDPGDPIERRQLELFTGQKALEVPVERVVLVVGDPQVASRLLQRSSGARLDPELEGQATAAFTAWRDGPQRRGFGADAAILRATLGDLLFRGFFSAWCTSESMGEFFYAVDPAEPEQVALGQFVPLDADYREKDRIERFLRKQRREGRFTRVGFDDLGQWDTWVSMILGAPDPTARPGSTGIESEHYSIEATLDPKNVKLSGKATLKLRALLDGQRVVTLRLFDDLVVKTVRDGAGTELTWFRSGDGVHVVLPDPTTAGARFPLEVDYAGVALVELERGIYAQLDTGGWYPHAGDVDRATYDVTLRWPAKYQLLASGRVEDAGEEGGIAWTRRSLDIPALAFSFEIGAFEVLTERVGHVELTVGFSKAAGSVDKGAKQQVIDTLKQSMSYFEETFGAYPLDHMTVATVPRGFSQGYPGFLTLSHYLLWTPSAGGRRRFMLWDNLEGFGDYGEMRQVRRAETVAHELAHQWWGNKLGWDGYRDQWLSEALADFSSVIFTAQQSDQKSVYMARHALRWKDTLSNTTVGGRTVESLGPVVLGTRLASSHSSRAYQAVVYDKGSVVFTMLARALGVEPFTGMLRALTDAAAHKVIDTATFLKAMERMSGVNLEEFADQFIYGTGIPEVYYSYDFVEGEAGWIVKGRARQVSPGRIGYKLEREGELWRVAREHGRAIDVNTSSLLVPFQIAMAAPEDVVEKTSRNWRKVKTTTESGVGGTLILEGESSEFSIPIDREPKRFWLDQRGEVLADFYSEQQRPKRMFRYRADELAASGQYEEAEATYRRALDTVYIAEGEREGWTQKAMDREARREDVRIWLGLAELYLDLDREEAVREALQTAEDLLAGYEKQFYKHWRLELRSVLDLRTGDYKRIYAELSKTARLDFPAMPNETVGDAARRKKFEHRNRRWLSARSYTLLAVAAHETDHPEIAMAAIEEAADRGADVAALKSSL